MSLASVDTRRAVDILREYRDRLSSPSDAPLRQAVERIITVFDSYLFNALLDIHNFYEVTLLSDTKNNAQKTMETLRYAQWLENKSSDKNRSRPYSKREKHNGSESILEENDIQRNFAHLPQRPNNNSTPESNGNGIVPQEEALPSAYEFDSTEEIILYRSQLTGGFGFSIAGGTDVPRSFPPDPRIYITRITPGGVADLDGRMRSSDILLSVNGASMFNVTHAEAVNHLKNTGDVLHLIVEHVDGYACSTNTIPPNPPLLVSPTGTTENTIGAPRKITPPSQAIVPQSTIPIKVSVQKSVSSESSYTSTGSGSSTSESSESVEELSDAESIASMVELASPVYDGTAIQLNLVKGTRGLGFSIAGGVGNEHIPSDSGIFISKVTLGGPADLDGRMKAGDRLTHVNDQSLLNVTHEEAVNILRQTNQRVSLSLIQPPESKRDLYIHGMDAEIHEDVVSARPLLPSLPSPPDNFLQSKSEESLVKNDQTRVVVLRKSQTGLGFNIMGGGDSGEEPIFLSNIQPGSVADRCGNLFVGDQILAVNGISLVNMSHEDAANILKNSGTDVELIVTHKLKEFERYQASLCEDGELLSSIASSVSQKLPLLGSAVTKAHSRSHQQLFVDSELHNTSSQDGYRTTPQLHSGERVPPPVAKKPVMTGVTSGGVAKRFMNRGDAGQSSGNQDILSNMNVMRASKSQNNLLDARVACIRTLPKDFHVRALFNYDANRDSGLPGRGLSFRVGDILHVVDAVDDEWWRARLVYQHGGESATSIIPSHWRVERRERARLKRVNFDKIQSTAVSTPNLGPYMDDGFDSHRKSKHSNPSVPVGRKINKAEGGLIGALAGSRSREGINEVGLDKIATYDRVKRVKADFARPVVIMGALKDNLHDSLVTDFPDQFGTCVPHTTRPPRENEVHGRDYFFVSTRDEMERDIQGHCFIEAGQYNGNLYGTSVNAVRDVANSGRHCILDVSGPAIRRLSDAGVEPIALLIHPRTIDQLRELLDSVGKWNATADEAVLVRTMDRIAKLRDEYGPFFTAVLCEDFNFDSLYNRVKQVIQHQSKEGIWMSSSDQLW